MATWIANLAALVLPDCDKDDNILAYRLVIIAAIAASSLTFYSLVALGYELYVSNSVTFPTFLGKF